MFAHISHVNALVACGVVLSVAVTDAVYVLFTAAVAARRRIPAATWSSLWYLISSFAVISYTKEWVYVLFAAAGSWLGAYVSLTLMHERARKPATPAGPV
jgi:predicted small integral membrane protein